MTTRRCCVRSLATCARATARTTASSGPTSGAEALEALAELDAAWPAGRLDRLRPADAADDRRRADRRGRGQVPDAKLLLLTAYADTDVAIKAINDIGLDYYMLKPWDPPEERLYPGHRRPARATGAATIRSTSRSSPWWDIGGRTGPSRSRRSSRATTCPTAGSTSSATTRPVGSSSWRGRNRSTFRSCSCPRVTRCATRRRSRWPRLWACAPAPSSRCTTSASSEADRPGSRPLCTPPRRGFAPSWSNVTRREDRPVRVRRSRTTSASPRDCPGPT